MMRQTTRKGKSGSEAAQERRDREAGYGEHQHAFAAEKIGEPAGERQNDGVGDEIGSQRPGGFVDRYGKAAGNVRERDVYDGGVQHFHESAEHHGDGDDPGVDVGRSLRAFPGASRPRTTPSRTLRLASMKSYVLAGLLANILRKSLLGDLS